jgi:hypothetical protein
VFPKVASWFRDPYTKFCASTIAVWLVAWLLSFRNIYGWLLDDEDTFYRFQYYAQGGTHYFDIPWFHAYMWFLMLPPLLLHWSVPSFSAPRAYGLTSEFRALILYTIVLHAIVLAMLAIFLRQLCSKRFVAGAAFLVVVTSPTLAFFTPLLDSRYLSLLAVLPAMTLMLKGARAEFIPNPTNHRLFLLCGFLLAVGEDIHYECLYLTVPFSAMFWALAVASDPRSRSRWRSFGLFVVGLCAWVVPVQGLSLVFHPFGQSYIGTLLSQYARQIPPYTRIENILTWWNVFTAEMGFPMMVAVGAGFILLLFNRFRPNYITRFDALVMLGASAIFTAYLLESPTYPFYRMAFGYQFFYAIMACVAVERLTHRLKKSVVRVAISGLLVFAIIFVPSFLRTPPVFAGQQGLGAAVNTAYALAGKGRVFFIDMFDDDGMPQAVIDRKQFDAMSRGDYLVTYFPESFYFQYPDILALLEGIKPIASYPTLWCTREMWAEVPTFYGRRDWANEPAMCQARVYSVADIERAERRPVLRVKSVHADSSAMRSLDAKRIFAIRAPSLPWYGTELWSIYWDLWVSSASPGKHWVDVRFAKPAWVSQVILVPPDFRVPQDFLWHGRKRVANIDIEAIGPDSRRRTVWRGKHLEDQAIIKAAFPSTLMSSMRLVLWQPPGPNMRVGLKYVAFPQYRVTTSWNNRDFPGKPGPGK